MTRAPLDIEVEASTSTRPQASNEPATLVDVFLEVARKHKRPDMLNYKSGDRWVPMSSDDMLAARAVDCGWACMRLV